MTTYRLNSRWEQLRGAIGRGSPGDTFVFQYDTSAHRGIHTIGMSHPVHVEFIKNGRTVKQTTLQPWFGFSHAECDTIRETIQE